MPDILALLTCLIFELDNTTYRQFGYIISAMLAMSGRITMKAISRWAGKGGSYRTVQRFFYQPHNWPTMMWLFFQTHCFSEQETYAIAGDEVVTTKSGKKTYGLLTTINGTIPLKYLLLDGKFGHNNSAQMTLSLGLHLVSKLRHDSALYLPYQGNNCRRKYGEKLNPRKLSPQYLNQSRKEGDWRLDYYQIEVLHKELEDFMNVSSTAVFSGRFVY